MNQPPSWSAPSAQPAPGWYFDGTQQRWWDGSQWGPAAPGSGRGELDSNDSTLATFSHLGALFGGFILPLVIHLISRDGRRPEARYHSREALNFQITLMLATFGSMILFFVGVLAIGGFGASDNAVAPAAGAGVGLVLFGLFIVIICVVSVASLVLAIIGAVKANRGERYRYPVSIRFLKDPTAS